MVFKFDFLPNEYFWGGATASGTDMPINVHSDYSRDFRTGPRNQMTPVFLSSKGRYVYSENSFKVWVENGKLCFDGEKFELVNAGTCLRDAYIAAMKAHFPFDGKKLPREFFKAAQYNTWMEFTYNPTQEGVLEYAHSIIDNGFAPGILIIDEGWHGRYGQWKFDKLKFPDPKSMTDELHKLGFTVMLWITPSVCCDGQEFIMSIRKDFNPDTYDSLYLRNANGDPAIVSWWNGFSAILDLRKKCDRDFLDEKLHSLMSEYGIDGFKFDGGSYLMYHPSSMINGTPRSDHDPESLNKAWHEFGSRYKFHEYKDTFGRGGKATIQRLCDRNHRWDDDGINTIIPCSILQGLEGYPFICPDMIGGGEWTYNMKPGFKVDEELFVRMAQASALFPMMQFSWAPWRALSEQAFKIVSEAAQLHVEMADEIIRLVDKTETEGEPILRNLEYNYPGIGYEEITDEFMLGENILVCPVVTKGTFRKKIVLPPGKWQDPEGKIFDGEKSEYFDTPLEKLLWFRKV